MSPATRLLALLLPALPVAAQQLGWHIPHRGAHVFTRTTEQFEVQAPPSRLRPEWIVQGATAETPHSWRHFACPKHGVPKDFADPAFDDREWSVGYGEFGSDSATNRLQRTGWQSDVLCLRTTVEIATKKVRALWFLVDHDDGVRIWLNGKLVVADDGFGRNRSYVVMGSALDAAANGSNVLAVQCTNVTGPQHLDVAMAAFTTLPPGVRATEDLLRLVREEREQVDRVRTDLFGAYRPPPLLLQGELDGKGQYVVIPPGDLRDLAWWLATDLRCGLLGDPVQLDAARMYRLGDLQLRGRAAPVDPDGWQTIEVTVKNTLEPAPRLDSKRHVDRFVRRHVLYGFDGTLAVHRHVTITDGKARVDQFRSELQGRVLRLDGKEWKLHAATLRQRESWRLTSTRDNQDAEFRAMVSAAIQRGTTRLRAHMRDLGSNDLEPQADDAPNTFHTGRLALGLLALVKGDVPKDDGVVQRGFAELRRRRLLDTYTLANAIMAIESLSIPASETSDLRSGRIQRPRARNLDRDDHTLVEQWAGDLLGNVDSRVGIDQLLRFNYTPGARFDNSVNQYGLLGLYSAHLCGVEIGPAVWEAAANHLVTSQSSGGEKIELQLVDYRAFARRQAAPDTPFTTARSICRANGWSYYEPRDDGELAPTWGSMTCAGITGLTICEAALVDQATVKRPKLVAEVRRARDDGFAWLARWMTARQHAGAIERQQQWFYYYLYSLERAALLSGIALIQDRDWYFEGAMVLVLAQQDDGNWPGEVHADRIVERNAMAILFLKQSTAPVLTGR